MDHEGATPTDKDAASLDTTGAADSFRTALQTLSGNPIAPPTTMAELPDPQPFDLCAPVDQAVGPQFTIPFRRPLLHPALSVQVNLGSDLHLDPGPPPLRYNCARLTGLLLTLAADLRFEQVWNLLALKVGDLSSTIALAPAELLVVEFQSSQRRVLEQSRVDSAEEMTSAESTTIDKEALNSVHSASKTSGWHVDGSASYSAGGFTAQVAAGYSQSATEASQTTIDHVSEATKKAAHNLKTLHKVEVRGVTEGFTQNRMTRRIRNPYLDRTASLNVYQLVKHYGVKTALSEIRPALVLQVAGLEFDADFVVANTDFLRDTLLDASLVDNLPKALEGADPLPQRKLERAREVAKFALRYLYDEPNMFNLPEAATSESLTAIYVQDSAHNTIPNALNSPAVSMDSAVQPVSQTSFSSTPELSDRGLAKFTGLYDAIGEGVGPTFTTLVFVYKVYTDLKNSADGAKALDEHAIGLVTALSTSIKESWKKFVEDQQTKGSVQNILDGNDLTEIFRRLSGFLALVDAIATPTGATTDAELKVIEQQEEAALLLDQLIQHLRCNLNYYTQQFLRYRADKTKNQALVDFVREVIGRVGGATGTFSELSKLFDPERCFIDKQQVVVPALQPLTDQQLADFAAALPGGNGSFDRDSITPAVEHLEVPADGIHLEVTAGTCVLQDLPPQASTIEVAVHDANLKLSTVPAK